jgi:hypothetical protein
MIENLETLRRLRAWSDGRPTARGETVNTFVADEDDAMLVAFVRMGGESRPWGIAYGTATDGPRVVSVPEGRNRNLVADMSVTFGRDLLEFFRHPTFSEDSAENYETGSPRQIWLPGVTHVDMLQFLALAYARTRWEREDVDTLRGLGNLCNCLFIERQRPGQQTVHTAADALRNSFNFPASPVRQAHLGYLMGWLTTKGGRDERLAAAHEAEGQSVATVLDPEQERSILQPLVEQWGLARRNSDSRTEEETARRIATALERELVRRWKLTAQALEILRNDPRAENPRLQTLVRSGNRKFYDLWGRHAVNEHDGKTAYWPGPFTDRNPRIAARGFHQRNAEAQEARALLVHGDRELQQEELAAGHGLIATVRKVDSEEPGWVLDVSFPDVLVTDDGARLVIAGMPTLTIEVEEVDADARKLTARPRWRNRPRSGGPLALGSRDQRWVGKTLVLLNDSPFELASRLAVQAAQRLTDRPDILDLISQRAPNQAANDDEGPVLFQEESA